jgi:Ca-activated chloride channel family protein
VPRRKSVRKRSAGRYALALTAALATPLSSTAQACILPGRAALLVLDASYSMEKHVATTETSRFEIARRAVAGMVELFPDDGYLALRFYGSRSDRMAQDCADTTLAVPLAPAFENRDDILLALAGTETKGLTPIARALEAAARDFPKDNSTEKMIIVVSDGIESCNGDPCETAAGLASLGFIVHTVGFVVNRATATQLRCIATATGGTYFDVPVALELSDTLKEAFSACPIAWREDRDNGHAFG